MEASKDQMGKKVTFLEPVTTIPEPTAIHELPDGWDDDPDAE